MKFTLKPSVPKEANIQAEAIQAILSIPGVQGVLRVNGGFVGAGSNKRRSYLLFRRADPIMHNGLPDLIVLVKDKPAYWVEMKRPGGELSPVQDEMLKWASRVGIPNMVTTSWQVVFDAITEYVND